MIVWCDCINDTAPEDQCRRCPHPQPARDREAQPRRADTSSILPDALDGRAGTHPIRQAGALSCQRRNATGAQTFAKDPGTYSRETASEAREGISFLPDLAAGTDHLRQRHLTWCAMLGPAAAFLGR